MRTDVPTVRIYLLLDLVLDATLELELTTETEGVGLS